MKQLPLLMSSGPTPNFDNFVVGRNAQALQHLRRRPLPATPVYLWGPAGCGKSHLLQALAHAAELNGERVGGFSPRNATPWTFDESWRAIVLDDCDSFDEAQQHAAFALFVEAATHGLPVVAAGSVPPVDLTVRDDLRTRLGWGLVFQLEPLSEAEARAVLRREADRRGIFLSDEVMGYLLTRFARDLGFLMTLLDRLDTFALASQRAVTVPLLKQMLAEDSHDTP